MAQSVIIDGKVVEEYSMLPLHDVEVRFLDSGLITHTDFNGEFSFPPQAKLTGNRLLQFTKTGYRSVKLNILVQDQDNIRLDPVIISSAINWNEVDNAIIELDEEDIDIVGFEIDKKYR